MKNPNLASVFSFESSRSYIASRVSAHGKRGLLSALAYAANCKPAHLSMVLSGANNLSQDQAFAIATYLDLTGNELEYFLLLIQFERAASARLREHLGTKLEKFREKGLSIKANIKKSPELSKNSARDYYGAWDYAAVHILLTIPGFRTLPTLAHRLNISRDRAGTILSFLVAHGLANKQGDQYVPTQTRLHLPSDSQDVHLHHVNWRLKAIENSLQKKGGSSHYSSVVSLSKSDLIKIRGKIFQVIQEIKEQVRLSKEETLAVFALDFFEM